MRVPKPAKHGRDHCPGGEDPIPCLGSGTESAVLFAWNYTTSNLIPTATWTSVAVAATGNGYYNEGWISESPGTFGLDYNSGIISNTTNAHYWAGGYAQFGDDPNVNETRLAAIHLGSGLRYISEVTSAVTAGIGTQKITAHAPILSGAGQLSVELQVWHNHGSSIALVDARLFVTKFELTSTGEFSLR